MPRGDFDKPSRLETPKRSNFRFLKKSWKFTPMEPILKKKWEFYVKTEILAPPVARLMILWGMDRSDHFASPHNRVCQSMTFRWLCGDRNINLFSKILIFTAFWLDLQVPSHSADIKGVHFARQGTHPLDWHVDHIGKPCKFSFWAL